MKVLLANSSFHGGGITTYATQLVACLSSDTEMTVVLGNDDVAPISDPRVKVVYHDTETLSLKNALFFIDLINNVVKPDVVIVSAGLIIPIIAPYLNDNIKVFTVSHSGRFFHSDYSAVNNKYLDGIIAASSDFNKSYLEKKFSIKDANKIRVVYNFVANDEELEKLAIEKKQQRPIRIVYAGASAADKSPELAAEVVAKLLATDLDFRFYWSGNPTIPLSTTLFKHNRLKKITQLLPTDERLVFPGRIPDKRDYDYLLGSANIMFAPSKNEGCSMALLEGHRAGCIFVVADYPNSNNEIVKKGNSGFVMDHRSADGIVKKICDIIINPSAYTVYYDNSHNTFKNLLSYPVWRDNIFAVLSSPNNHKTRKASISKIGILRGLGMMKWLYLSSTFNHFFQLALPSYISFRRQYKSFRKGK